MPRVSLRHVVARRSYELLGSSGIVTVAFAKPVRTAPTGSFKCFYQITGLAASVVRYAGGTDAVQSLLLAMVNAATLLYSSSEYKEGRLQLHGSKNLDLPAVAEVFDGSIPEQTLKLVV
jgi:hypothetical protein